jgi:hypothetical protein
VTDLREERRQVRAAVSELFTTGSQATVNELQQQWPLAFRCFEENEDRFWSYLSEEPT